MGDATAGMPTTDGLVWTLRTGGAMLGDRYELDHEIGRGGTGSM